ncbi:MAG: T9SS type A sorting domain-containing protein [Bacteroidia bacterium]|nr:T9SS type A sorting domain-containing protein [Bacteroidia bacterium]
MSNKFTILLILLFCFKHGTSQIVPDFDTTILSNIDHLIYNDRYLVTDKHGNKYLSGFFKGQASIDTITISTNSIITSNLSDKAQGIYCAKYNSSNKFISLKKIAEGVSVSYAPLEMDQSGNLIYSITYAQTLHFDGDSANSAGQLDGLILKLDSNMVLKHVNKIGDINDEYLSARGVCVDDQNNYYVSGYFNGTWTNSYPNYKLYIGNDTLVANTMDIFIAKFDSLGVAQWSRSYGGIGEDYPFDLKWKQNSLYLIAGHNNPGNPTDIGGINVSFPLNWASKSIVARLDSTGSCDWVKKIGTIDNFSTMGLRSLSVHANRIYVTGHSFSNNQNQFVFEGGPTLSGYDQTDCFIACYDTLGNFKWNTILDSYGSEYLTQLESDILGNVYGVGKLNYTMRFDTDTLFTRGGDDVLVCSYDSSGNFRWAISGGGIGTDIGNGIVKDANGKLFIVGGTTSPDLFIGNDTVFNGLSQSRSFITSIDSLPILWPNSISAMVKENMQLKIQPNPAGDFVSVSVNQRGVKGKLQVYDLSGRPILVREILEQVTLNVSEWNSGIYLLKYLSNDGVKEMQRLIINH